MNLFAHNRQFGRGDGLNENEMGLSSFEMLEPRVLLSATLAGAIDDVDVAEGSADFIIDLGDHFSDPEAEASGRYIEFDTILGSIFVELYADTTPQTVANFLNYVDDNDWDGTFFHRSMPGFVIQAGGFTWNNGVEYVPADAPVVNEPEHSNIRGTIAMAKIADDPDSATSQWFFNLADNSENLDNQNGGFTAFGEVLDNGMDVVDAIAALERVNVGSPFDNLPVVDWDGVSNIDGSNLVFANSVDRSGALQYSVISNSNEGLVSTQIVHGELVLDFAAGQSGYATIEVQAMSRDGLTTVTDTFEIAVGQPVVAASILPQYLQPGAQDTIDLSLHFYDSEQASSTLTYAITGNTNSDAISAVINGTDFEIQADPDNVGYSVITIEATDDDGLSVSMDVTVASGLQIRLGADEDFKTLTFTDSDGTPVTVTYSGPGTAAVFLDGTNHQGTPKGTTLQLAGNDIDVIMINITDATDKSSLTIKTGKGGDNVTTVKDIDVTGTLKSITAKTTDLLGDITVTESLLSLSLNDIDAAHTITIGSRGNTRDALTFSAGSVIDTTLISDIPIKSISVKEWLDQDGLDNDLIQASSLGSLTTKGDRRANPAIAGDFQADLDLNDTTAKAVLGSAKIAGDATGFWQVVGNTGSIAAGSFDSDWTGFFATDYDNFFGATELDVFNAATWTGTAYEVKSIKVTGNFDGEIYASKIGSVSAGGDSSGAVIATNTAVGQSAIKSVSVKGDVTDIYIYTAGITGSMSMGSVAGFTAYLMDVGSFKVAGHFSGNMAIGEAGRAGSMKSFNVKGSVTGDSWGLYGDIGTISVGGDITVPTLTFGSATTETSLKSLNVKGSLTSVLEVKVYGQVGTVNVGQDFTGRLRVGWGDWVGELKSLNVKGTVYGFIEIYGATGTINITGNLEGEIQVGSIDEAGSLKSLNIKGNIVDPVSIPSISESVIQVYGETGSIAAGSMSTAKIELDSVKSIKVKGSIADTEIEVNGNAGSISASGDMTDTTVMVTGAAKTISTKGNFSGWVYSSTIGTLSVKGSFAGNNEIGDAVADARWTGFVGLDDYVMTSTSILAQYIKALNIGGDMAGNVAVNGVDGKAIDKANIKGVIQNGSIWELGNTAARADLGGLSTASIDGILLMANDIKSIKSNDDIGGGVIANSLGSLSIKDTCSATLTLAGLGDIRSTLGSAKIGGIVDEVTWTIDGSVGAISAGGLDMWQLRGTADVKSISAKTEFELDVEANTIGSISSGVGLTGSITLAGQNNPRTTIKSITAKGDIDDLLVDVTGEMGSVSANNINNLAMNFDNAKGITAKGNLTNSELNGDMMKTLSVKGNMTDTNLDLDQVVADRVTALGSAKIGGNVTGGEWDIEGHVGAVSANSFGKNLADVDWTADILGDLKGITTKGNLTGDVTANAIASVSVKGDLVDSSITVNEASANPKVMALGKMSVTGSINNTDIDSAGNVGTVSAKYMLNNSSLKAGVSDTANDFPDNNNDYHKFDQNCTIKSLTLKGARDEFAFNDSVIAAWNIDKVSIKEVDVANADEQFGITANSIGSLMLYVDGERLSVRGAEFPEDIDDALTDTGIDLDDAEIRILVLT